MSDEPNNAMEAEFADMAAWTADAALQLGPDHYLPAGCRGSGGPRTLDLLLDGLDPAPGSRLLDVGAGVGGPAAYAARTRGLRPIAVDPNKAACRAAARLFAPRERAVIDVVVGDAFALPFPDCSFAAAWCLGVLCTVDDHPALLNEIRRVITPGGRAALLVFVVQGDLPERPDGNTFPTEDSLRTVIADAGLRLTSGRDMVPADHEAVTWRRRGAEVTDAVKAAHGHEQAWQQADGQAQIMSRLLTNGLLIGRVIHLVRDVATSTAPRERAEHTDDDPAPSAVSSATASKQKAPELGQPSPTS